MHCLPIRGHGHWLARHTAGIAGFAVILTVTACSQVQAVGAHTASPASSAKFKVTSTIDGLAVLPHRIHWQAFPAPSTDIIRVDYVIDGKQLWVEHVVPYFYGDDGNYLVTSFLTPGRHVFTVRAFDASGHSATDTVTASVVAAPSPPAALDGSWKKFFAQAGGNCSPGPCPPAGYWRLVISPIGWQVYDTGGGGGLYDVSYLSAGMAEINTGMATGHPGTDGNAWCNEPGGDRPAGRPPVYVRWAVHGNQLSFTPAGSQPGSCMTSFTQFLQYNTGHLAFSWTRAGK